MMKRTAVAFLALLISIIACTATYTPADSLSDDAQPPGADQVGTVTNVVDGDTIDVDIDGTIYRVRYVGVNTPERDESCYSEATRQNGVLVEDQQVTLVKDTSETDRYDRLLRYVYVNGVHVNEQLIRDGAAEVVLYQPDDQFFETFRGLEQQAAASGVGCHPTGIFDDGRYDR